MKWVKAFLNLQWQRQKLMAPERCFSVEFTHCSGVSIDFEQLNAGWVCMN